MTTHCKANEIADFDAAVLGAGLPPAVETLITQAGLIRQHTEAAEALLERAYALAPTHPATLIARYRFHFYGNRLARAREVALEALQVASAALYLPPQWQTVRPDERFRTLEALPRFYLFCLKGFAYLSLRLGEIDQGRAALAKLAELDPGDAVGAHVLDTVLRRMGRDDWGYEDCPDIAHSPAEEIRA